MNGLERRVPTAGRIRMWHDQDPRFEKMKRWVCRVIAPSGEGVGSGILIAPAIVLTCHHVVEPFLNNIEGVRFVFDDLMYFNPEDTLRPLHVRPKEGGAELKISQKSPFDLGETDRPPEEGHLDYALIELDEAVGEKLLENGNKRGWLDMASSGGMPAGGHVSVLSYPKGQQLGFSSSGELQFNDVPKRFHYTAATDPGSSGGLVFLDTMPPRPLGMHIGFRRRAGANFGVSFPDLIEHMTEGGKVAAPGVPEELTPLKIAVVCGLPDDKDNPYHNTLGAFFSSEPVLRGFARYRYRPFFVENGPEDLNASDYLCIDRRAYTLKRLHEAAQADIAVVICSRRDIGSPVHRDRLLTAYGFLCARLGWRRVHLICPSDTDIEEAQLGDEDFVHLYDETIHDVAPRAKTIAWVTRAPEEDGLQGLFELAQVALPDFDDEKVFGADADFGAKETLHIIGLRFGRLGSRLGEIFAALKSNENNPTLTIAFPGATISDANPYLFDALQAGGGDTLSFLEQMQEHLRQNKYEKEFLQRVKLVALNDIPTFILTAADLDFSDGRMLIAPAFKRVANGTVQGKPRSVVHHKLSTRGIYQAYLEIVRDFLDETKEPEIERPKVWTIDQIGRTEHEIDEIRKLRNRK